MRMQGVWVPLVTPFRNGQVDTVSLDNLVERLVADQVSGVIPLGTTGECPVVSTEEHLEITRAVVKTVRRRVPVVVGAGGPDTLKVIALARQLEDLGVDGILSVCPYYNRPNQAGIRAHFEALADATTLPIVLYNIPYRTGVNIDNDTIRVLAKHDHIVGLKDSCGNMQQSADLLFNPPADFAILTGEDALFYTMLALGAHGGILAAAHYATSQFVAVWQHMLTNDHLAALAIWRSLAAAIALFFAEPNPAPLKHLLFLQGALASPQVRLPLVGVSEALQRKLEALARRDD